ncbi:MAG: thioredoxin family protein [Oligoflexia bacterium]|nr:thioredoxin family protein [Oligoflexia bacterium]
MKPFILVFLLFFPLFSLSEGLILKKQSFNQKEKDIFHIALVSPYKEVKKNSSFLAGLRIQLAPEWHSYWSFAGDFGQAPQIHFSKVKHIQIKPLPFPRPQRKSFLINKKNSDSFIYENELLIPFEVFIEEDYKGENLNLSVDLEWAVCKDICLSKKNKLQLQLKLSKTFKEDSENQKIFQFWKKLFPLPAKNLNLKSYFQEKGDKQIIEFSFKTPILCLDLFPKTALDFSTKKAKLLNQTEHSCSFEVKRSNSNLNTISGLLIYSLRSETHSSLFQSHKNKALGLLWFILMAFLGGLLLNVMPCVLPIIFLKFYNNLNLAHQPKKTIFLLNASYSAGVISSFLVLAGAIFIFKQLGESAGWGFHLQSPLFVSGLALLFTLMAFYFLDILSFSSPKLPSLFKDQKASSHFLTGVLSTTAASPCTVPFMASAVGFAFSRSYLEIFSIFFFLGFGLSFPYLALSLFPQVLKYIPSPGQWANLLKKLLSIPLFLTSLWLIYILYFQLSLKAFLLTLMMFPLLLYWIFFQKHIPKKSIKKGADIIIIVLIALILALQNSLKTADIEIKKLETSNLSSQWQIFNNNKVLLDKKAGKNIFVALGAEWCLTCKFNERVFETEEFKNLVKENNIALYYGDWTNKTDTITYFLESYSRQGVPFYIFFKGEEELFIFPTLLLKESFLEKLTELSK